MPNNDEIRTSIKKEDYVETKDGAVTSAFASILSIELEDLMPMLDEGDELITEAEWLEAVDYLCDMIGQELHEHLCEVMGLIRNTREKGKR